MAESQNVSETLPLFDIDGVIRTCNLNVKNLSSIRLGTFVHLKLYFRTNFIFYRDPNKDILKCVYRGSESNQNSWLLIQKINSCVVEFATFVY